MRPIIGLTSGVRESRHAVHIDYVNSVAAAGGTPIVLPSKCGLEADYLAAVDGLLFTGGGDVQGKYYNQVTSEKAGGISEERDEFEITLARLAKAAKKPVMGICRGKQVVNIAVGGDIFQHIEGHDQKDVRSAATHYVNVLPGTKIHGWLKAGLLQSERGDRIKVNSFHHQNVDKLAEGFITAAISDEGRVEAYESVTDWFCACYQWHPEAMLQSPEHGVMLELFKAFIDICQS
ncbi:MAG: gamma-glutamyl-gamma-aminobutyrate hydrolase family protein [Clostridiales bacterium]|nr:gamma-glutamyl-gamma-aminobutyrate hydrolase family protein [Clostridiales bacterium]